MNGVKNAFRIIMVVTFLASLVGVFSAFSQMSQMSSMGMPLPWGALIMGACLPILQVATVWLPAEVLFDIHNKM